MLCSSSIPVCFQGFIRGSGQLLNPDGLLFIYGVSFVAILSRVIVIMLWSASGKRGRGAVRSLEIHCRGLLPYFHAYKRMGL